MTLPQADSFCAAQARPEILAPAGDWECLRAAVENGADAVYFGLDRFNARMRAHNFRLDDLPEVMSFLHRRGVRGYVTFNTLVFASEIADAEEYLRGIIAAGADACIVQDSGICRLIRSISPDFPIHASTQMTVSSAEGVRFAQRLGCNLVVLARECSLENIRAIKDELGEESLPLETFVHGALCVAYSGQCLTSESLGGRSANRGECAQACRLPYELIVDGARLELGDRRYLLSPQDLSGLELVPDLVRAGISSFKIEGRLKAPEYVANITSAYRRALDVAVGRSDGGADDAAAEVASSSRYELEMAFSRGLYSGWLKGIDNQRLVHGRYPKKRGVYLGEVSEVRPGQVLVELRAPLKPGDGVVFDRGRPDEPEQGGRVYGVSDQTGRSAITFGNSDLDLSKIKRGNRLWKTSDPELDKRLRQSFEVDQPRFRRPVSMRVEGRAGERMKVEMADGSVSIMAESELALAAADRRALDAEVLRDKLGRLGGTPFYLDALDVRLEGDLHLPLSELNRLRRILARQAESRRAESVRWTIARSQPVSPARPAAPRVAPRESLIVLVRSLDQLEAALDERVETIYCELEEVKRYREAVRIVRERSAADSFAREIWIAPPRIYKPGEEWILKLAKAAAADGYLVRNYDHLRFFGGERRRGDFSLNVANHLSARHFMESCGLETLTASYDLNVEQVEDLLSFAPAEWFELTLHHNMPMFHMEHCVFCAFLSKGTDFTDCGRPCDRHELRIRDNANGREHFIKADTGCRNTVFNGQTQSGAEYLGRLRARGLSRFRVELMSEPREDARRVIRLYRDLLEGRAEPGSVWRELAARSSLGVTRGQLSGPSAAAQRVKPKGLEVLG